METIALAIALTLAFKIMIMVGVFGLVVLAGLWLLDRL